MPDPLVVVGAGQAGIQVAATLRQLGHTGPVVVVGAEHRLPYELPPLSKEFLAGRVDEAALQILPAGALVSLDLELVLGDPASDLDAGASMLTLASGRQVRFSGLALATGANPRRLPVEGADARGVVHLRSVQDSLRLREALRPGARLVVVGGGFLGLEAASVARSLGAEVAVVESLPRLLSRSASTALAHHLLAAHRADGVDVHLGRTVVAVDTLDGAARGVHLDDGAHLRADVVLVAVGVAAETTLAQQAGLTVDTGVLVDRCARTSAPGVVAVGDCAVLPSPTDPEHLVRLESVQHAVDHGRLGAATLLGGTEPYTALPRFWSEQAGSRVQIAGLGDRADADVVRAGPDGLTVARLRDGRLVAVEAVDRPRDFAAARKALARGPVRPDIGALADPSVPLAQALAG